MRKKNVKKMLSVMLLVSDPIQDLRTGKTVQCRWKLPSRSMPSTLKLSAEAVADELK